MSNVKHSPAPWELETIQLREERSAYEVVKDAEGGVLFDTINSNVAVIHTADEGGAPRWDEQGRVNLTLAAAAPELLATLIEAEKLLTVAMFEDLRFDRVTTNAIIESHSGMKQIRDAIAKAKGAA